MEGQPQKRKRKPKMKQKKYEDLKHSGRTKRKRQMEDAFKEVTNTLYNEITEVKVETSCALSTGKLTKPVMPFNGKGKKGRTSDLCSSA